MERHRRKSHLRSRHRRESIVDRYELLDGLRHRYEYDRAHACAERWKRRYEYDIALAALRSEERQRLAFECRYSIAASVARHGLRHKCDRSWRARRDQHPLHFSNGNA